MDKDTKDFIIHTIVMLGITVIFMGYFRIVEHNPELQQQILDNAFVIPIAQSLAYEGYVGYIILKIIPMYREKRKLERNLLNIVTMAGIVFHKYVTWIVDLIGITITFYAFFIYSVPRHAQNALGIMNISDLYFLVIVPSLGLLSHYLLSKRKLQYRQTNNMSSFRIYEKENRKNLSKFLVFSKGLKILIVFLILGGAVLISAIIINDYSRQGDRISFRPLQGLTLFYTTSYNLSDVQVTFIINENRQAIHIFYSIDQIQNDDPFIAFVIPYSGHLKEGEHGWTAQPMQGGSTLIYKQFSCDVDNCNYNSYKADYDIYFRNDNYNLLFEINGKIDSRKLGEHSLRIPVNGVINNEIFSFIQDEVARRGAYSWTTGFANVTNVPTLSVSVSEDVSGLNFVPDAYPSYANFETSNRTIFEWKIPKENTVFHLDYFVPSEKEHFELYSGIWTILIGIGVAFIVTGIAEYVKLRIEAVPKM